jgi:hypothetical protein
MTSVFIDSSMPDDDRRVRLYEGDIFILSPTSGTRALVNLARRMIEEAFLPHDPCKIHENLRAEAVAGVLAELKPQFIHHPECKKIIPQVMREHGIDVDKLYFDVPRLRTAYPSDFLSSGIAYAFHPHRDTWYSAPMCQINWWIPIYPLASDNAMGFYPRYFREPVKNNSEIYNYYEWNANCRAVAAKHIKADTREQPKPQEELQPITIRYLPPPGGIIVFSGAQLHETVPNTAGIARYSIDFRTVYYDDVIQHRGAPNVDSRCSGTTMRDYVRASDFAHLPEEVIALYDDASAKSAAILYFGAKSVSSAEQSIA